MIITETGMHPDIKALVYVAAVQPDVGESLSDLADKMPPAAKSIGPVGDGFLAVNPEAFPSDSLQTLLRRSRVLWQYPKYRFRVMP
jgi:hypothetical protein